MWAYLVLWVSYYVYIVSYYVTCGSYYVYIVSYYASLITAAVSLHHTDLQMKHIQSLGGCLPTASSKAPLWTLLLSTSGSSGWYYDVDAPHSSHLDDPSPLHIVNLHSSHLAWWAIPLPFTLRTHTYLRNDEPSFILYSQWNKCAHTHHAPLYPKTVLTCTCIQSAGSMALPRSSRSSACLRLPSQPGGR